MLLPETLVSTLIHDGTGGLRTEPEGIPADNPGEREGPTPAKESYGVSQGENGPWEKVISSQELVLLEQEK